MSPTEFAALRLGLMDPRRAIESLKHSDVVPTRPMCIAMILALSAAGNKSSREWVEATDAFFTALMRTPDDNLAVACLRLALKDMHWPVNMQGNGSFAAIASRYRNLVMGIQGVDDTLPSVYFPRLFDNHGRPSVKPLDAWPLDA